MDSGICSEGVRFLKSARRPEGNIARVPFLASRKVRLPLRRLASQLLGYSVRLAARPKLVAKMASDERESGACVSYRRFALGPVIHSPHAIDHGWILASFYRTKKFTRARKSLLPQTIGS